MERTYQGYEVDVYKLHPGDHRADFLGTFSMPAESLQDAKNKVDGLLYGRDDLVTIGKWRETSVNL